MCRKSILIAILHVLIFTASVSFAESSFLAKSTTLENKIVFSHPDRFAAWPANNGVWIWKGKEILVGFTHGSYEVKKSHDIEGPTFDVFGRSIDGGQTWKIETPRLFSSNEIQPKQSPGRIIFTQPDFAMRIKGNMFFFSYNRGKNWKGPYLFGDIGLPKSEFTEISSRTDYIVNGPGDCLIFTAARIPGEFGTDRAFCMRTTDSGKTFKFVSWIVPPDDPHRAVMPSTVRITKDILVTAIRRRSFPEDNAWIDAYMSEDNGKNWKFLSKIGDTGNWNGNPPALERLDDGRLCCVFGNRTERRMYAAISHDKGYTWTERIVIRDDFRRDTEQDLGYPQLVKRRDGKLVAMYYWATSEKPQQHIAATIIDLTKSAIPAKAF